MSLRLNFALDQLQLARRYTTDLLASIPHADWYRRPTEGVTHVAWQVGHLAMAEFRLCLWQLRGSRPGDEALLSDTLLRCYSRDSVPSLTGEEQPSPGELQALLDRVHAHVLQELSDVSDASLDEPTTAPHRIAKTKFEALTWCVRHEMLHAGQIGLLRRLLGAAPIW